MDNKNNYADEFGTERIWRILLRMAPPVMLAQLIQALYNIVDSIFVGRASDGGLAALSIVYPIQLLMIALACGTGVGINTVMSARMGQKQNKIADEYAGIAAPLAILMWTVFAAVCFVFMPAYARTQTSSPDVVANVVSYGRIVCLFSLGLFLESGWSKVLQAKGDMKTPMIAQIVGALTNIILDPILIFGYFGLPEMGITGAAIATVAGQSVAAIIVMKRGYYHSPTVRKFPEYVATAMKLGAPSILMQSAYTLYIFGLNTILATFSDAAVTVLGLYYKWQTLFIIPQGAMQTCTVPVISYNYAAKKLDRCRHTINLSILFGIALMSVGTVSFAFFPETMLRVFTSDPEVINIGLTAFPVVGLDFVLIVGALMYPVLFQALGKSFTSAALTVIRTVVLFVPLGYLFSRFGLEYFWLTYPVTDTVITTMGFVLARRFFRKEQNML